MEKPNDGCDRGERKARIARSLIVLATEIGSDTVREIELQLMTFSTSAHNSPSSRAFSMAMMPALRSFSTNT
jgi:hypothetical protein